MAFLSLNKAAPSPARSTYRAPNSLENRDNLPSQSFKANTSYVTGSHSVKFGMDMQRGHFERNDSNNKSEGLWYRTRDYIPNQLTLKAPLAGYTSRLNRNLGIYAQDRWTTGRLTLNGGIRFDFQNESADAFVATPNIWTPNRNTSHEEVKNIPNWKDINPRVSGVYDLFGNGRTALKASASRGVEQDSIRYALANHPATTFVTSVNRVWTDANSNFVPDCDLLNPVANGECQGWSDLNFGTTRQSTFYDPAILDGWGVRPNNWEFSAGLQHEIVPRLSASFGYFRRVGGNFNVVDNELVTPADFTEYSVPIPNDPRLPGAGGTLGGIYDLNLNRVGFVRNVIKDAANFGQQLAHWNGFDVTIDARLRNGLTVQGGVSSGNSMTDNCEVVGQVPEMLQAGAAPAGVATFVATGTVGGGAWTPRQYCHQETGFLAQYKGSASYLLPYAVRIGAVLQSIPGPMIGANNTYVGTVPSLGRAFSQGVATVNLIEPGTSYGDRLNQLDLRFTQDLHRGQRKARRERRPVQRAQLGCHHHAAERLWCGMDEAVERHPAAIRQVQCEVGFLVSTSGRPFGPAQGRPPKDGPYKARRVTNNPVARLGRGARPAGCAVRPYPRGQRARLSLGLPAPSKPFLNSAPATLP